MKKLIFPALMIVILCSFSHGLTRPDGMGNAFTAVADDLNAINYNPAGLAFMKSGQMMYDYRVYSLEDHINQYLLAMSKPLGGSSIALEIFGTDIYDTDIQLDHHVFTLSYAGKVTDNVAFGINLNSTNDHVNINMFVPPEIELSGYSVDIGILAKPNRYFSFGMMQNAVLFPEMTGGYSDGTPARSSLSSPLRIGIALYPAEGLILAVDGVKDVNVESQQWDDCYGIEYDIPSWFAIRSGYKKMHVFGTAEYQKTNTFGLTLNFIPGIKLDMARINTENNLADYGGLRWDF